MNHINGNIASAPLPKTLTSRLNKELQQLTNSPPYNITVQPHDDNNILHYMAQLIGPIDTPYYNGIYTIDIIIPTRYPFIPPQCKFLTRVYHPNIDSDGRICCSILSLPPSGTWKPNYNLAAVLTSLYSLLQSPNCDDPLMHNIAAQLTDQYQQYYDTAMQYNQLYAVQNTTSTHVIDNDNHAINDTNTNSATVTCGPTNDNLSSNVAELNEHVTNEMNDDMSFPPNKRMKR